MDGFTQSALLKALGWALFDSLWQMALLWLGYILLVSLFSRMAAQHRHGLALLLVCIGTIGALFSFVHYLGNGGAATGEWLNGMLTDPVHPGTPLPAVAATFIGRLLPWFSSIYLLMLVWLILRYSNHYLHARLLKIRGLSPIGPDLRVFVEQTARRMGIKRPVGVWLSSMVDIPLTLGCLRPVVLIPFAMVNNLSLQQVEAILLHELAHIKRYDYLLNLAVTIMQIVFFFNPFARLLIRHIRKEREHRCDDLVIQSRYDPYAYASALLSLATLHSGRYQLAMAATGKNDRLLLQRVKRILKQDQRADRIGPRPMLIFLSVVLVTLAALITLPHRAGPLPAANPSHPSSLHTAGSQASTKDHLPLDKALVFGEEKRSKKQPVLKRDTLRNDRREELTIKHGLALDENNMPESAYSADQVPAAINMTISHIDLQPPRMTRAGQLLTDALTDPKSSATEVKANILKAIAANETTLERTRKLLNTHLQAISCDSSAAIHGSGQGARQEFQRQLEEENTRLQQQLLLQQYLQKMLERAAKKLSIVYI